MSIRGKISSSGGDCVSNLNPGNRARAALIAYSISRRS
jgi:hypothetical protein